MGKSDRMVIFHNIPLSKYSLLEVDFIEAITSMNTS